MVGNENKVNNYYNVSNGKIVRSYGKTEPENVKTTSRVNKNGDTVYEQLYDFIEGQIIDAKLDSHEQYGDSIKLTLKGEGMMAELQIKFDSAYGRSFLFKIPSIDIKQEVKIKPYSFVDKDSGRTIIGLNIFQAGQKLPNAYTKDKPNGLPELKKVKFNGKEQWDKTDQLNFLKQKYDEFMANFLELEAVEEESVSSLDDLEF